MVIVYLLLNYLNSVSPTRCVEFPAELRERLSCVLGGSLSLSLQLCLLMGDCSCPNGLSNSKLIAFCLDHLVFLHFHFLEYLLFMSLCRVGFSLSRAGHLALPIVSYSFC